MHNHQRLRRSAVVSSLLLLLTAGCAVQHKDALLFGTNTQGGLKVGVDQRQIPEVMIGYSRQEAAMVPLFVYNDGMLNQARRDLDTTGCLQLALDKFNRIPTGTTDIKEDNYARGALLINEAAKIAAAKEKKADKSAPVPSTGLARLQELVNSTKALTPELILKLQTFTEVEIRRPSTAAQYLDEYKYVARVDARGRSTDAYSVLGTFKGSAKASANTQSGAASTEAGGEIAQYFATGIAAQNLSRSPAAVSSDAAAITASRAYLQSQYTPQEIEKREADLAKREDIAKSIAAKIGTPGAYDTDKLVEPLKKVNGRALGSKTLNNLKKENEARFVEVLSSRLLAEELDQVLKLLP